MTEAEQWLARGEACLARRALPEALAAFDEVERLGAERLGGSADRCAGGRWMAAMFRGDFAAAWAETDAIRARGAEDTQRLWCGESAAGRRVVVRCLHGLGDAVQMMRYAPRLAATAASVVFEVPPRLLELAGHFRGVQRAITWGEAAPREPLAWDVQMEAMELPYLFRTAVAELPLATGYLQLSEAVTAEAARRMGARARPRVGLVWAGGAWDPGRGIGVEALRPLLSVAEIEFWSLQGGDAAAAGSSLGLRNATAVCGDGLLPLAATMGQMDLVITIDTLAAHLAGALGRPVWLLLQHAADWRWMIERTDSPWYPTMRIFRQPAAGDWGSVVEAVREALCVRCVAGF